MSHISVNMADMPMEVIESTEINPLISKCQIKVCYVGDEPNRNRSIITKETAEKLAPTLRGCPIVGYYNETKGDFEEHNKIIDLSNGKLLHLHMGLFQQMLKSGFNGLKMMEFHMNI